MSDRAFQLEGDLPGEARSDDKTELDFSVALTGNFIVTALTVLIRCLKRNGMIGDTQFEDALRETIEADGASRGRLDYQFLQVLLCQVQAHTALDDAMKDKPERTH